MHSALSAGPFFRLNPRQVKPILWYAVSNFEKFEMRSNPRGLLKRIFELHFGLKFARLLACCTSPYGRVCMCTSCNQGWLENFPKSPKSLTIPLMAFLSTPMYCILSNQNSWYGDDDLKNVLKTVKLKIKYPIFFRRRPSVSVGFKPPNSLTLGHFHRLATLHLYCSPFARIMNLCMHVEYTMKVLC